MLTDDSVLTDVRDDLSTDEVSVGTNSSDVSNYSRIKSWLDAYIHTPKLQVETKIDNNTSHKHLGFSQINLVDSDLKIIENKSNEYVDSKSVSHLTLGNKNNNENVIKHLKEDTITDTGLTKEFQQNHQDNLHVGNNNMEQDVKVALNEKLEMSSKKDHFKNTKEYSDFQDKVNISLSTNNITVAGGDKIDSETSSEKIENLNHEQNQYQQIVIEKLIVDGQIQEVRKYILSPEEAIQMISNISPDDVVTNILTTSKDNKQMLEENKDIPENNEKIIDARFTLPIIIDLPEKKTISQENEKSYNNILINSENLGHLQNQNELNISRSFDNILSTLNESLQKSPNSLLVKDETKIEHELSTSSYESLSSIDDNNDNKISETGSENMNVETKGTLLLSINEPPLSKINYDSHQSNEEFYDGSETQKKTTEQNLPKLYDEHETSESNKTNPVTLFGKVDYKAQNKFKDEYMSGVEIIIADNLQYLKMDDGGHTINDKNMKEANIEQQKKSIITQDSPQNSKSAWKEDFSYENTSSKVNTKLTVSSTFSKPNPNSYDRLVEYEGSSDEESSCSSSENISKSSSNIKSDNLHSKSSIQVEDVINSIVSNDNSENRNHFNSQTSTEEQERILDLNDLKKKIMRVENTTEDNSSNSRSDLNYNEHSIDNISSSKTSKNSDGIVHSPNSNKESYLGNIEKLFDSRSSSRKSVHEELQDSSKSEVVFSSSNSRNTTSDISDRLLDSVNHYRDASSVNSDRFLDSVNSNKETSSVNSDIIQNSLNSNKESSSVNSDIIKDSVNSSNESSFVNSEKILDSVISGKESFSCYSDKLPDSLNSIKNISSVTPEKKLDTVNSSRESFSEYSNRLPDSLNSNKASSSVNSSLLQDSDNNSNRTASSNNLELSTDSNISDINSITSSEKSESKNSLNSQQESLESEEEKSDSHKHVSKSVSSERDLPQNNLLEVDNNSVSRLGITIDLTEPSSSRQSQIEISENSVTSGKSVETHSVCKTESSRSSDSSKTKGERSLSMVESRNEILELLKESLSNDSVLDRIVNTLFASVLGGSKSEEQLNLPPNLQIKKDRLKYTSSKQTPSKTFRRINTGSISSDSEVNAESDFYEAQEDVDEKEVSEEEVSEEEVDEISMSDESDVGNVNETNLEGSENECEDQSHTETKEDIILKEENDDSFEVSFV